jgi:hypothetical protein
MLFCTPVKEHGEACPQFQRKIIVCCDASPRTNVVVGPSAGTALLAIGDHLSSTGGQALAVTAAKASEKSAAQASKRPYCMGFIPNNVPHRER